VPNCQECRVTLITDTTDFVVGRFPGQRLSKHNFCTSWWLLTREATVKKYSSEPTAQGAVVRISVTVRQIPLSVTGVRDVEKNDSYGSLLVGLNLVRGHWSN